MKRIDRILEYLRVRAKDFDIVLRIDQQTETEFYIVKDAASHPDLIGKYIARLCINERIWFPIGEGETAEDALQDAQEAHGDVLARYRPAVYVDGIRTARGTENEDTET